MQASGISIQQTVGKDVEDHIGALADLSARLFSRHDPNQIQTRLPRYDDWALHSAVTDAGRIVAFKLGHREDSETFYSWLGGVDPDFRRKGLALLLMNAQHCWAKSAGYTRVTTRTEQGNKRMQALNIAARFVDIGLLTKPNGRVLRCFKKPLI